MQLVVSCVGRLARVLPQDKSTSRRWNWPSCIENPCHQGLLPCPKIRNGFVLGDTNALILALYVVSMRLYFIVYFLGSVQAAWGGGARGRGGMQYPARLSRFFSFPWSANHEERDWPPPPCTPVTVYMLY